MTDLSQPVPIVDPFTGAFDSVFRAIRLSPSVAELLEEDNIVSGLDIQPQLDYREMGDLPALIVMPDSSDGDNLFSSSTTADFEMVVLFRLMTGDERIGKYLFPMRWALIRAFLTQGIKLGDDNIVSYNVTPFTITNTPDETTDISDRGWIAEAAMQLNMCIKHSNIVE